MGEVEAGWAGDVFEVDFGWGGLWAIVAIGPWR